MSEESQALLRAILSVLARQTFPPERLLEIVDPTGQRGKQLKAFNLCDGTASQAEIAKAAQLDQGSLSRTVTRWIEQGVVFRLGEGRDAKLLHVYAITAT